MGKKSRLDRRQVQRTAAEEAARRSRQHRRRLPFWISGGVVVVAAIVVIALVVSSGGGSSGLPAGTRVISETNHKHVTSTVHYNSNPPAGGAHSAVWLNCGVYASPVKNEQAVHSLEHGSVWITYRPDVPAATVTQLRSYVESHYAGPQRYLLLSPYPGIPAPIVVTAWGAQVYLNSPTDPRLAAFVSHYAGGGQGGEKGGPCTGGAGTPIG